MTSIERQRCFNIVVGGWTGASENQEEEADGGNSSVRDAEPSSYLSVGRAFSDNESSSGL